MMGKPKRIYDVKSEHSVDEVFEAIKDGRNKFMRASVKELRIQNFYAHGVKCVECGRVGTVFRVERASAATNHKYARWHLNLYCIKKTGGKVMMTADHIVPKSRGGPTTLENLQPMCAPCNSRKGNLLPGEEAPPKKKKSRKKKRKVERKKVLDVGRLFSPRWMLRAAQFTIREHKIPALPKKWVRK